MAEPVVDPARRNWLMITCGAGAVGGVATAVPFVASFTSYFIALYLIEALYMRRLFSERSR